MRDDPDVPLLAAIAAGDKRALNDLYTRHGLSLLNMLLAAVRERELAEEVLQNVMLAVWRGAGKFRGDSLVSTWLFAIARQQALKMLRDQRRRIDVRALDDELDAAPDEAEPQQEALQAALAQLPVEQQEALELVYYRGLTIAEAAAQLKTSEGTLKSRLHRARAQLRKLLTAKEIDHA